MYYTEPIKETMIEDFETLTYREYRASYLHKAGAEPSIVAFGAFSYPRQPIGLILGEIKKDGFLQVYTVFVKPKQRRLGVAQELFKEMEQAARNHECQGLYMEFIEDHPYHEHICGVLAKCGWDMPAQPVMRLYKLDMEPLKEEEAPLFSLMDLPDSLAVSSWQELSQEDFEELKKGEGVWYPELTSPFLERERVDPYNSVFLRNEEKKIIGWTITHRLDEETMLYRNVFVREELRSMGYAMLLMARAIWRQYDRGIYKLMFCVHVRNKDMNRIVSRFMKPLNYTVKDKIRYSRRLA